MLHNPCCGTIFSYNDKCSCGLPGFDTTEADPEISYRIINNGCQLRF